MPTAVKLARGNPGHRPLNKREPVAKGIPTCPPHINEEGKREWKRIVKELKAMKILARVDRTALAAYCQAYGRWVEAEEKILESGMIVKAPSGYPMQNPFLSVANKAMEQMKAFLTEFGMTPSSRSRLEVDKTPDDDPLEALLKRRAGNN